jgi:hypothetical protein
VRDVLETTFRANFRNLGDQVQWQRAKADMYRWLENHETKHAEFYQLMKTHGTMRCIWERLAKSAVSPGRAAYARKQAAIFERLKTEASTTFQAVGHPRLKKLRDGETLASAVLGVRESELAWMKVCAPQLITAIRSLSVNRLNRLTSHCSLRRSSMISVELFRSSKSLS